MLVDFFMGGLAFVSVRHLWTLSMLYQFKLLTKVFASVWSCVCFTIPRDVN